MIYPGTGTKCFFTLTNTCIFSLFVHSICHNVYGESCENNYEGLSQKPAVLTGVFTCLRPTEYPVISSRNQRVGI